MAAKRPSASTLKWCQQELGPICEGIGMVVRSQIGYDGRRIEKQIRRKALQSVVMGGQEVDPLKEPNKTNTSILSTVLPSTNDALQRARVVAAGIETFAKLMAQGTYPGSAGFTISVKGERVYVKQSSPIQATMVANLMATAEKISKGAISLAPFPLPTITKLGNWAIANPTAQLPIPPQLRAAVPAIAQIETLVQSILGVSATQGAPRSLVLQPRKLKLEGVTDQVIETHVVDANPSSIVSEPLDKTLTKEEADFLLKAAKSVDDENAETSIYGDKKNKPQVYRPELPKNFEVNLEMGNVHTLTRSNESSVPATRIGRLATFGQLAFGLLGGATAEVTRRTFGIGKKLQEEGVPKNPFLSEANADRIVATLCRVRGAALKLGQMLSIQDSSTVPPALLQIFERVRQSADFMPLKQVHRQMRDAFGDDWREKFQEFEDKPFACASIGQVHKATLKDGRIVAVKVQYPGVAEGIDSDIDNLVSVLSVGGIFPKGMFLDAFVGVARRELKQECDYEREARAMRKFRELIADWKDVYVPEVIDELSSSRVLTTELVYGKPVDACVEEPQVVRDYIAGKFIELCLKEIFVWRFMQTDPNWSNFFLGKHPKTGEPRLVLLDFGASRAYGKKFVDIYMNIIKAAYDGDKTKIIEYSREIGFLTGYETTVMEDAHVESVMIMGETLASNHPYDFANQDVTKRIQKLIPVMLEHRLTSPPEEIYSLHRKLSGCYLLAAKLKATVSCGGLFHEIHDNYVYGEDGKDINID
ncbi:CBN-COQ-8 protein [Caenorhabditis brenneri]|uniref:CBN-COQ-8 protein n=1 Tax=Caenorhabditis brenneri TaxID=135651 RepID=G0MEI7_CAEBE|nr:CBN-COQ-8 protein [Caenorhabditis brenneri]